jgi:hypothetical protein
VAKPVRHPLFARVFTRLRPVLDRQGAEQHRRRLLAGLSGRVLEVGAGDGGNFAHYPATVTGLLAVEPEPYLRAQATRQARQEVDRFRFPPDGPPAPATPHALGRARRT